MFARLTLPRFPVDVLQVVMTDGRVLCAEVNEKWEEVFLYLVAYRAARWRDLGQPDFAAWFGEGMKKSQWCSEECRAAAIAGMADAGRLRSLTEEALEDALVESSRLGFWVNLGISSGVEDGSLWYEVRHADQVGSQRLTLGAGDEEAMESMSLSLEVREDVGAGIEMFGPMLSALCFGRAVLGVMGRSRPARVPVKLKLFEAEEVELSAAQALVRLAELAEQNSPNILML